jgi:hypothetical protein
MAETKEKSKPKPRGRGGMAAAAEEVLGPIHTGEDAVYQLTRAIQTIAKQQDAFKKSVEQFHEIEKDIDVRISSSKKRMDEQEQLRKKEVDEMDVLVERERKRRRIDLEQDIREFGTQQVAKMLTEQKKVAILAEELEAMKTELETLRKTKEDAVLNAVREALEKSKLEMTTKIESQALRHQAEMAAVTANRDQQKHQIKVLDDTIAALRNELDQQRKLTREVAYAQAQAQAASNNRPQQNNSNRSDH